MISAESMSHPRWFPWIKYFEKELLYFLKAGVVEETLGNQEKLAWTEIYVKPIQQTCTAIGYK